MKLASTLVVALLFISHVLGQNCWDPCFGPTAVGDNKQGKRLERAGAEIRRLITTWNVAGIAFLFETTLRGSVHDFDELTNPDSGPVLVQYEKNLASILATLGTPNNNQPIFLTQFDEEIAWGFEDMQCLDACVFNQAMPYFPGIEYIGGSDGRDAIGKACNLAQWFMNDPSQPSCSNCCNNQMAISVTNSKNKKDHHWCKKIFDTRFGIVIRHHEYDDIEDWASTDPENAYFPDHWEDMMNTAAILSCINNAANCNCPSAIINGGTCWRTRYGSSEDITSDMPCPPL